MKASLVRFTRIFSVGAVVGIMLFGWLGPKYILWYFKPPVSVPYDCSAPIAWAMNRLLLGEVVGLVLGGLVSTFFVYIIRRKKSVEDDLLPPA